MLDGFRDRLSDWRRIRLRLDRPRLPREWGDNELVRQFVACYLDADEASENEGGEPTRYKAAAVYWQDRQKLPAKMVRLAERDYPLGFSSFVALKFCRTSPAYGDFEFGWESFAYERQAREHARSFVGADGIDVRFYALPFEAKLRAKDLVRHAPSPHE